MARIGPEGACKEGLLRGLFSFSKEGFPVSPTPSSLEFQTWEVLDPPAPPDLPPRSPLSGPRPAGPPSPVTPTLSMNSLTTLVRPLAAAATTAVLAGAATAQVLPWNQLFPTTTPSSRERVGVATDGNVMYLYGGQVSTTTSGYDELWAFDGTNYTLVTGSGASAGPRTSPGMCWDDARGKLVVFSGKGAGGVWANYETSLWEWDPVGGWVDVTPATGPDPRWLYNMEYVPGLGAVFHGGVAWDATAGAAYRSDETWAWNGAAWTLLSSTGPARGNGQLVYRPTTNDLVYFGGVDAANVKVSDTYVFDLGTGVWSQVITPTLVDSSATPGLVGLVGMAGHWDPVVGKVVLHGGQSTGSPSSKTWEFDGADWTDITSTSTFTRRNFDTAWVGATGRAYGAMGNGGSATNTTYERGVSALGTFTVLGTGCATSGGSTATLSSSTMPAIGQSLVVDFADLTPGTLNFAAIGGSDTLYLGLPLPLPLGVILPGSGAGCSLQVSADIDFKAIAMDVSGTTGTLTLPIPNNPSFVGLTAYVQGIQLELAGALTAANSAYAEVVVGQL